ncbi:MAG: Gfo/Idh/MocA family oxidoreductase [Anaerolineales bacterium]|nr:Gfo/Idh/MocA family oxidoreductase [Anaerolineales bacterium]
MSDPKARIGIIGTGWWSTTAHIPGLLANPAAELAALSDRSEAALARATAVFGPRKTYTDYHAMLAAERLDGVIVATNHTSHYAVAKACLEAGVHVLLEKPMVLEAAHAHDLVRLAAEKGRELIVGYPWNYTAVTRRARDVVASGRLGALQLVNVHFASMVIEFYRGNDQAYAPVFGYPVTGPGQAYSDPKLAGGGQGHLQMTHSAGALFFITGLQAERVSSFMDNYDVAVDVIDAVSVRFKPANGRAAIGTLSSTGNLGQGDGGQLLLSIYGEKGYLLLDQGAGTLYVRLEDGTEENYGPLPPDDRYPKFATSANLVDVALGRAPNGSPGSIAQRVVELLDAAYRSTAQNGQPINVADLG